MVVTVAVKPGQSVRSGDSLLSIEAMKMETQLRAERDGVIDAVLVKPGGNDRRTRSADCHAGLSLELRAAIYPKRLWVTATSRALAATSTGTNA